MSRASILVFCAFFSALHCDSNEFLATGPLFVAEPAGAPLLDAPRENARILAEVPFRAEVKLVDPPTNLRQDWYAVEVAGRTGYMSSYDLMMSWPLTRADLAGRYMSQEEIAVPSLLVLEADGQYTMQVNLCTGMGQVSGEWELFRKKGTGDSGYFLFLTEKASNFPNVRENGALELRVETANELVFDGMAPDGSYVTDFSGCENGTSTFIRETPERSEGPE